MPNDTQFDKAESAWQSRVTPFAISHVPLDPISTLKRAREGLGIGCQFIDDSQEERDNWKGHADLLMQQITECLRLADARSASVTCEKCAFRYGAEHVDDGHTAEQDCPVCELSKTSSARGVPIDMLMFCPRCKLMHVDAPNETQGWTNPPHATHTCQGCGLLWRPSNALTNGVAGLPAAEAKHLERMVASDPRLYVESAGRRDG